MLFHIQSFVIILKVFGFLVFLAFRSIFATFWEDMNIRELHFPIILWIIKFLYLRESHDLLSGGMMIHIPALDSALAGVAGPSLISISDESGLFDIWPQISVVDSNWVGLPVFSRRLCLKYVVEDSCDIQPLLLWVLGDYSNPWIGHSL